jgi:hypothetical protein
MMPSGAVIPDPTYQLSFTLGDLLGATAPLVLLSIAVAFVVIVAGVAIAGRGRPVPKRIAAVGVAGCELVSAADELDAKPSRHAA